MKHQEINGKLILDLQEEYQLLTKLLRQEHQGVITSLERAILPELQDLGQTQQQQLKMVLEKIVSLQQTTSNLNTNLQQVKQSCQKLAFSQQDADSRDLFLEKARFHALEKKFKQVLLWCQISTLSGAMALGIFAWSRVDRSQIVRGGEYSSSTARHNYSH